MFLLCIVLPMEYTPTASLEIRSYAEKVTVMVRARRAFRSAGLALPVLVDTVTVLVAAARWRTKRAVGCCGARNRAEVGLHSICLVLTETMLLFLHSRRVGCDRAKRRFVFSSGLYGRGQFDLT